MTRDQLIGAQEEWRPVSIAPGYEVSNLGRVRSIPRSIKWCRGTTKELDYLVMKLKQTKAGYIRVTVSQNSKQRSHAVHRLVATAFIGAPSEDRPYVNHKNGRKDDNGPENLEWVSASENLRHAFDILGRKSNGKGQKGEKNGRSKLREADVLAIRTAYAKGGVTRPALAQRFNISIAVIGHILSGRIWKCVAMPEAAR